MTREYGKDQTIEAGMLELLGECRKGPMSDGQLMVVIFAFLHQYTSRPGVREAARAAIAGLVDDASRVDAVIASIMKVNA